MKTSVNMNRTMGEFNITQRTKDSFFNATKLLSQWNEFSGQKKQMAHFLENKSTDEFIKAIEDEENVKERNSVIIKSRGKNGGTWMHPYLFIDFAMWINPRFKYKVIQFVYDQLISLRIESGDRTKELNKSIGIFEPKSAQYMLLSKNLNYIVFNNHFTNIRNSATEDQIKTLVDIQKKLAFAIDMGYIRSFDELINEMRRLWTLKWDKNYFGYGRA